MFCAFREGRDLFDGRPVFVPAAAIHCPPPGAAPIGPLLWPWTSNGMGAHPDGRVALLHALLEAVERDQLARALPRGWTAAAMAKRAIAPGTLPPRVRRWARRLETAGFALSLFDLSTSLGVPVAGALLFDRENGPVPLAAGYACRLDPEDALLSALLEAAQSRLTDIHGARDDVEPMKAADVVTLQRATERLHLRRKASALPRPPRTADLAWLLRRLWLAGHRRIAAFHLAPPELGLAVQKVVAPSLLLSELL
jgi:ribosomal protein S12 methylthiotransferase accessory factor